jgi:hypothetical protein
MRRRYRAAVGALLLAGLLGSTAPVSADFMVISGSDPGAGTPDQPRPNSDAAALRFDTAAAQFGAVSLIDFESAPLGSFTSLQLAPGVTVTKPSGPNTFTSITDMASRGGYNTTPGGARFLQGPNAAVTFAFDQPIHAFGTYITGRLNGPVAGVGSLKVDFEDGTALTMVLSQSAGASFFGFLDTDLGVKDVTLAAAPTMAASPAES